MFNNYLKIAIRNLLKQKGYSAINILGLAIGLTSCLLISLYVADEISYDRFHEKADSIYRMNWDFKYQNNEGTGPGTPPPLAAAMVNELPEVKGTTRLYPVSDMIVRHENSFFSESNIVAADSNFFEFFSFQLIEGNPETALDNPNSVILTEETARKYFGDQPATGQLLTIGEDNTKFWGTYHKTFEVTGIVENIPRNSHIRFDLLTSISSHPEVAYFNWSWVWMQLVTYARVDEGVMIPNIEEKLTKIVAARAPAAFNRIGFSYEEMLANGGHWNFIFQPLDDIYLGSAGIGNRLGPVGNKTYVTLFAIVAVFILFLACMNFINLTTARSVNRAREVGVRKVLGSVKRNLVTQFLTESIILSTLAILTALGLTELLLTPFNQIAGKTLELNVLQREWLLPFIFMLTAFVGIAAGSYPALYLTRFQPVHVLKGKVTPKGGKQGLRNTLVVLQFAISIALIICTGVVHKQMQFLSEADYGFNKEGVLVISNENQRLGDQAETFRDRISAYPDVLEATLSTGVPPQWGFQDYYKIAGRGDEQYDLISYMTDENFLATLGIEIEQGRGFSDKFNESRSVILNQSAVTKFGIENPIGAVITYPESGEYEIIGVIEDFNFLTLQQPIMPFALFHRSSHSYDIASSYVAVRVKPGNLTQTVDKIKKEWHALSPTTPFHYSFIDENFEAQYRAERRLSTLFLIFASLAIFIACLGLFSLATFAAAQRTKEIGVRKVLGASVPQIIFLLSKEFSKLVLIAFVIATPVAFFFARGWLDDFAYRTDIGPQLFIAAGVLVMLIAWATVSYQAIRAALANPVRSLRYE